MYGDKINAVFASNHHAIHSKCYERYLNDTVLTALSAVYHILYPNINQFEQPVSRRHLILKYTKNVFQQNQNLNVLQWLWYPGMILMGKVNLHATASYIFGIVQYFLKPAYRIDVSDEPSRKYILTTCLLTLLDGKSQQYNHVCSCVVSPCPSPA